jgi:hypothetical protein
MVGEWTVHGISRRGGSHVRNNKPNQDSVHCSQFSIAGNVCGAVIVSDGHGSDAYTHSHIGSHLAVQSAFEVFSKFALKYYWGNENERAICVKGYKQNFARSIHRAWRDEIHKECNKQSGNDPLQPYGCTLLAVFIFMGKAYFFQLGDGEIYIQGNDGSLDTLIPFDKEPGEQTDSMCDMHAWKKAEVVIRDASRINMILVASDGLSKSFPLQNKEDKYPTAIKSTIDWIKNEILGDGLNLRSKDFEDLLATCTTSGSGDDTSIAIAYCKRDLEGLPHPHTPDEDVSKDDEPRENGDTGKPERSTELDNSSNANPLNDEVAKKSEVLLRKQSDEFKNNLYHPPSETIEPDFKGSA